MAASEIEVPHEFAARGGSISRRAGAFYSLYLNGTKFFEATPATTTPRTHTRPVPPRNLAKPGKHTLDDQAPCSIRYEWHHEWGL